MVAIGLCVFVKIEGSDERGLVCTAEGATCVGIGMGGGGEPAHQDAVMGALRKEPNRTWEIFVAERRGGVGGEAMVRSQRRWDEIVRLGK